MVTATSNITLACKFWPKQAEFDRMVGSSPATILGYGGSRGGSKSDAGRKIMLKRRFTYPGTWGLIMRRIWAEVRQNHIEPMFREWPALRDFWNEQQKTLRLPNGSALMFRSGEHSRDIYEMQGNEFYDGFVDQAEQFSEAELVFLKTCIRWPNTSEATCKLMLTFNPGNIGHAYLKRIFYDKKYKERERPEDYAFLQAYGWDNAAWVIPALTADGKTVDEYFSWPEEKRFEYFISRSQTGRELDALPQAMRIGHLLGLWDQFAGQYFDILDPDKHFRARAQMGLKPWHRRWIGIDWGFAHNSSAHWCAQVEEKQTMTYQEFVRNGLGARALAQEISDRCGSGEQREKIDAIFLSPDAFAKRTSENTVAEQMNEVFIANGLPACTPADDDRVGGWHLMYEMLRCEEWLIADDCPELIACIPMLTRQPMDKNPNDCLKFEGDDPADSCFVAGTLIQTAAGEKPIEEIQVGDLVLTRQGFRRVLDCGLTRKQAPVFILTLSNGRRLSGTGNHPTWREGAGFSRLDSMRYGDILVSCELKPSFSTGLSSGVILTAKAKPIGPIFHPAGITVSVALEHCIKKSGKLLTDLFQRATRFITEIEIPRIINSPIWNVFPRLSMASGTEDEGLQNYFVILSASGHWPLPGTEPLMEKPGIESTPKFRSANGKKLGWYVRSAKAPTVDGKNRAVFAQMLASLAGAGRTVWTTLQRIVSVAKSDSSPTSISKFAFVPVSVLGMTVGIPTPVYNLTVQDVPEYFANGVLVHNCRYALKSFLGTRQAPYDVRVTDKVEAFAQSRGQTMDTLEPTSRAMLIRQAMILEKKNNRGIRYRFGKRFRPGAMS